MEKKKKPFYKKWWFWLIVVVVIGVAGSGEGEAPESSDVKTQGESEVAQSDNASAEKVSTDQTKEEQKEEEEEKNDVPTEYKSALKRAKNYSDMMHMSKQGLYDQLTSEYADKLTPEAAHSQQPSFWI